MPPIGPVKRKALIRFLKQSGFEGPFSGGKHEFMVKGSITICIPNPHQGDIGKDLLVRILRQAAIDRTAWENL